MSKMLDQRVVSMEFDNKNFESNAKTSMKTIENLNDKLNFKGVSKGTEALSGAIKKVDLSPIGSGIEAVKAKFSALQVIGTTALANITNSAVNAGKKMISALTIEPIKTGFQEYETQINAVQTILANTQSKGSTLTDVNKALDTLNTYADKTIYNFTEMTRNIGTFTAAGVDLQTSVDSIQGIANLAAMSGSSSQQASTAMYQLSQALAAGKISLMDWNSVVNAGMGGEVFQNALIRTSELLGTGAKAAIDASGSFRDSLTEGEWLTNEVLTETLKQLSGAYSEADLISQGYTQEQAKEITQLAQTAEDAATKVKTFSQLWDVMKESAQSGWTQTWEILIGDFEEAKELLTSIADVTTKVLEKSAKARNDLLQGWKDAGGRTMLLESFTNIFKGLGSIIKPIKEAFKDIFPPVTVEQLVKFTEGFKELTSHFKISEETAGKLKSTFKGIFSVLEMVGKAAAVVGSAIIGFLTGDAISSLFDLILTITAAIGDFLTSLNKNFTLDGLTGSISKIAGTISDAIGSVIDGFSGFGEILSSIGQFIGDVFGDIWDAIKNVFSWISENVSGKDILAGIIGGGALISFKKFLGLIKKAKELLDGGLLGMIFGTGDGDGEGGLSTLKGFADSFSDILGSVNETLQAFTQGIKVASLVSIAVAIGILSKALKTISELSIENLTQGLVGIAGLMTMLGFEFKALLKSLKDFDSKGIVKAGTSLILVAYAIKILSDALIDISALSLGEIAKGLLGVAGCLLVLAAAVKIIDKVKIPIKTSIALLALAESCKILASAFEKFGELSWGEIGRGLASMGGALLEMVAALAILDKVGGGKTLLGSVSLLIAVQALDDMATALKKFGKMSWSEIKRGLVGMGGALTELGLTIGILGKIAGFSGIIGAGAILIVVQGLDDMAKALEKFGSMSWNEIKRGLVGMGGALTEVSVACGALGKIAGFSGIIGAGAILIVVQGLGDLATAFQEFGKMSWDDIKQGLVGMGGALAEVSVACGALGKIAGFSGIIGAGAILIVIQGLSDLATAFQQFGSMSWDDIKQGLVGMGGALAEVAIACGGLGMIAGFSGIIGSGAILIVIQGLGDLADGFKKFGEMSWDEIKRGLVGMGGALTELSVISGALGYIAGLPALLGSGAILLAVQGLGDLADAFKKFGEMSWDEITQGLAAMGGALSEIAFGSLINALSSFGADAISTIAEPLGALADSVKKWQDVSVPENLGAQLADLAGGVQAFTFGEMGADTLSTIAAPIGTLADSIKKWADVVIPEELGGQIGSLAEGIKAFTFGGMGADALSTVAEPLGKLADSVLKWTNVVVPEGLGEQLSSLASGVKAFTLGGWGADTISTVAEPLGNLADSIVKWTNVIVPEGLGESLVGLANGVKAFTFVGWGADTIATLAPALGTLADSVTKWANLIVPEGLSESLVGLANGVKAFTFVGWGADTIATLAPAIGTLADAIKKWTDITVPEDLPTQLGYLADGVKKFTLLAIGAENLAIVAESAGQLADGVKKLCNIEIPEGIGDKLSGFADVVTSFADKLKSITDIDTGKIESFSSAVGKIVSAAQKASGADVSGIGNFVDSVNKLNDIDVKDLSSTASSISTAISDIVNTINNTLSGAKDSFSSSMSTALSGLVDAINNASSSVNTAASNLVDGMISAISGKTESVNSAFTSLVSGAAGAVEEQYSSMSSAGAYLGEGLIEGIESKEQAAYDAGFALGQAAVQGEKDGQQSGSPSKATRKAGKWLGEGLILGMRDMGSKVYDAGMNMGERATNSINTALDLLSSIDGSNLDVQPKIRPVLDLSDVKSGIGTMNNMFGYGPFSGARTNVGVISSMMNARIQNEANDELLTAINKLQKSINSVGNTSYTINGITYDDGTNISNAVTALVRAARIERRV